MTRLGVRRMRNKRMESSALVRAKYRVVCYASFVHHVFSRVGKVLGARSCAPGGLEINGRRGSPFARTHLT